MRTLDGAPAGRRRVAPLAPDDRRAALIEATLPLMCEHGLAVSTRQIADAAGVAEGTIFRVFPDKTSLFVATVLRGTDPAAGVTALRSVDRSADLRTRLTEATRMLAGAVNRMGRLNIAMRELMAQPDAAEAVSAHLNESRATTTRALIDLMAPDAALLRVSPASAARMILVIIFTANNHLFPDEELISAPDLASVLLDGLLAPAPDPPPSTGPAGRPS